MNKELILVVDDDPQITSFLKRYLEKQDFSVICASDSGEMEHMLANNPVDLCVLDIGLPGKSGLDITRDLRAKSNLPILVLSGRDETFDRVVGLEFGADDYMVKPFEPRELVARIRSVLRRSKTVQASPDTGGDPVYLFADWRFNPTDRSLINTTSDEKVALTTTEFEILHLLVAHPGKVFDRNRLLDAARGRDSFSGDRTIDVHIMRLRKKLGCDSPENELINTVHGIGYTFVGAVTRQT
ncbi:MAG TPA: response regulator transcription factor [Aliiroseovarius sp.]|nr:response regulator transcription factor [Aliiroseovarius sp.]